MNLYKVKVTVKGTNRIESPKCPSSWRGSGCYDIDVPVRQGIELEVYSYSQTHAEEMAKTFCCLYGDIEDVEQADIDSVDIIGINVDDGLPEVGEVVYGNVYDIKQY